MQQLEVQVQWLRAGLFRLFWVLVLVKSMAKRGEEGATLQKGGARSVASCTDRGDRLQGYAIIHHVSL